MSGFYPPANMGNLVVLLTLVFGVTSRFINFHPGYEYEYTFNSKADVKNMGQFHIVAKVSYTNVEESKEGQEIALRIYALELKSKHTEKISGHNLDLSRWFSFVITSHGEILHVYHPMDDDDEAVAIKKGLAAVFASRLHHHSEGLATLTKAGWQYKVKELGQEGEHEASYTVLPTRHGHLFTKIRNPKDHPVKQATSGYTKKLYYNNDLGNVQTVEINETFEVMKKVPDGFDPYENTRRVKAINDFTEINTPGMSAIGSGKLDFLTRNKADRTLIKPHRNMTRASIHIKKVIRKKPTTVNTDEEMKFIEGNLTCMRSEPETGSKQMSKCFNGMLASLKVLPDDHVTTMAMTYFPEKVNFPRENKDRGHVFDGIAALSTDHSQRLLLDMILNSTRPNAFLVKRLLFHLISMDRLPIDGITRTIQEMVFDPDTLPFTLRDGDTHNRMVLSLGVLARRLWDNGRREEGYNIIEKMHDLLGLHDPWLYRQKRSLMTEDEAMADDHWRVVLLETLGNAALDQSYEYIVSHVNTSNSQWVKRAGIHSLRKYHHEEAAQVMLNTALFDEDEKVRFDAFLQYRAHPKAAEVVQLHPNHSGLINGSIFTDPRYQDSNNAGQHSRHKRGIFDKNIVFILKPPGVDWGKKLGSVKLGASFGLTMENLLDFKISPTEGHAKVYVYDEAYATVHLGLLGFNLNFFQARLCFKGSVEYNLNVLQEFDIDSIKKLVEKYDKLKEEVVGGIESGVALFRDIVDGDISIADIIDELKQALEDLPLQILAAAKKALTAMLTIGEIDELQLPPFIRPTRNLIVTVTNLYNDIKSAIMTFFNTLIETVTIIIPRTGTQIYEAIKTIVDGFEDFNAEPQKAISAIGGQVVTIGMEIKNLVDAIISVKKACFFLKGQRPYWWNLQEQADKIQQMAAEALAAFRNGVSTWFNKMSKIKDDQIAKFTDGKFTMASEGKRVMEMMTGVLEDIMVPLDGLRNLGKRFEETFEKVESTVKSFKEAYESLREGYRKARSLIDKVFGPKCHKKFPRATRQPGGGCDGSGFYPSLLKNGKPEYKHKGVDVKIVKGSKVYAPFTGNIMLSDTPNEIIINPTGGSLKKTEIIITNIQPNATILHPSNIYYAVIRVKAGEVIGVAIDSECDNSNNHIHFSLKRSSGYVDPTRYLEPRLPSIPQWVQECDDYKLVWKMQTVAAGSIIGKKGKKVPDTSPTRTGKTITKPQNVNPSKNPASKLNAANNKPDSVYQKQKTHKTAVDNKVAKTKDKGLKSLMKSPQAFLKNFKIGSLTMGALVDLMEILGLEESQQKLVDVIIMIKKMIDNKPCFNPKQMTDKQLRAELTERRKRTDGPRETLIKRLTTPSNKCARMLPGMPKNVFCTFDSMCLGVECCADFKVFFLRKSFKMYARLDPCQFQFVVGVQTSERKFEKTFGELEGLKSLTGGFDKILKPGIQMDILGGVELLIKVIFEKDDGVSMVTLGAGFCSIGNEENCILFTNILEDVVLPFPICREDGSMEWPKIDYKNAFSKESIKKRLKQEGKNLVKNAIQQGLAEFSKLVPCLSEITPGKSDPCSRPETLTTDLLRNSLQARKLSFSGTRDQLMQRLKDADKECTVLGKNFTLPAIKSTKLDKLIYLQLAPNCLRIDACMDLKVPGTDMNKAIKAHIELDPCRFTLILNFETCTEEIILLGYDWGKPGEIEFKGDAVKIKYIIDRNEERKVFIVTMGMKLQLGSAEPLVDSYYIENFEVPIPLCNDNLQFPGSGSLTELAKKMGRKLAGDAFNALFRMLKLDTVFTDGKCNLQPSPEECPWKLPDIRNYLPTKFKDRVTCSLPENCFGVQCCADFVFDISIFKDPIEKSTYFYLKFDPCEFRVDVGFGSSRISEKLLTYDWGKEMKLEIGNGEPAPVEIRFSIGKYDKGFILDLSVTTCIPIENTQLCFPEGGLQVMKGERIPACDAKSLVEFTRKDFSLANFAKEQGLDLAKGLARSAATMLLDRFGISEWLLTERCDVQREPYSSAINGLKNDCKKSLRFLPKFPKGIHCHLAESCTKIDCCFNIPFLDMSFKAVLDINMCDYNIFAAIENKTFHVNMLGDSIDLNTGVSASINISDVFTINFDLKKRDKVLLIDLNVDVCFMSDECSLNLAVLTGLEVPQFICDLNARANFSKLPSITEWAKAKGQEVGKAFTKAAVNLFLEQYGLKDFMLNPGCDRSSLVYQPADADSWKNDCPYIASLFTLPNLKSLPANCYINDKCLGIDCCLDVPLLGISLHASFTIDLCNFYIKGNIEQFAFQVFIFKYNWGSENTVFLDGIPVFRIKFKIDRIPALQVFIVDLSVSVCMDSTTCQLDIKVMHQTQLPMPGCAPIQGFKIPDWDFSKWLKEKGDEMNAQLALVLFKTLKIDQFLLEDQCQDYISPFKGAVQGWKKDCPQDFPLPPMPENLVCYITDYCTGITCCAKMTQIRRNFNAHLLIDSCNFVFSVGIELLEFSYDLIDYTWGKTETIDLNGLVAAEFSIQNLADQKKFLLNLKLKLCLKAGTTCLSFDIFTNTLVPKPLCDWEGTKELANFDLSQFVLNQGGVVSDRLTELMVVKLLNFLKVDQFMLDNQCSMATRGPNGWTSACPTDVSLPTLPSGLSCSIPNHCTAIDCCVNVPLINKNVHVKVDLDLCRMTLNLEIEKLVYKKMLIRYKWGELDHFSLRGIFKASFIIQNWPSEKQFLVSLNISVCFDKKSKCQVSVPVVTEDRFPNPVCDWESLKALKSFSLKDTLAKIGGSAGPVTDVMKNQIAEAMGLSSYLLKPSCNRETGKHKADSSGWNNACPWTIQLPPLPGSVSCYIPDYCTGIDCCTTISSIGMNVNVKVLLNACDRTLTVGIEDLVHTVEIFAFSGEWKTYHLNKIVNFDYKIVDLSGERRYLVSVKASVCLEPSSCINIPIVTDARFPKLLCSWNDSLGDISLTSFLKDIGLNVGDQLRGIPLSKFFNDIGITPYLSDPECSPSDAIYAGAVGRWKKECTAPISLPDLPENVVCHLPDPCGSVQCCVYVPVVGRSFQVKIGIDPCTFSFSMGIEKLVFSRTLDFSKGSKTEHFNLKKIVRLDFTLDDLFGENKILMNVKASICFGETPCKIEFDVLKDVKISKPLCDRQSTQALLDFNLDTTLADMQATGLPKLTSVMTSLMFEKAKIGKYLKSPECNPAEAPYTPSTNGWNNDCPVSSLNQILPQLDSSLHCYISDICTAIECCVYSDYLSRSFHIVLSVNMCTLQLNVATENLSFKRMLFTYNWGQPDHFYMGGFIRIDYTINRLQALRKLEVSASVSICLKSSSCLYVKPILDKTQIPQPLCDWKGMTDKQNFKFSDWSLSKGLSSDPSSLTGSYLSQFLDDMAVAQYLTSTPCDQNSDPYFPANTKNWKTDCTMFNLPNLHDSIRCHLTSDCSTIDCCVRVPVIQRNIRVSYQVDVCQMEMTMGIEELGYHLSLLEYKWDVTDEFRLGVMGRLEYKIKHLSASGKFLIDLTTKMCFGDKCVLDIPLLQAAELTYSSCQAGLSVPFKGVTMDVWRPESCVLLDPKPDCSFNLPPALNSVCQLAPNCMGIICCLSADLQYLGIYSLDAGIEVDDCNMQLKVHVENKAFTLALSPAIYDKSMTKMIGEAITLSFLISKTPSAYTLTFEVKICLFNVISNNENCIEYPLLDRVTFSIHSTCGARKRRSAELSTMSAVELLNHAIENGYSDEKMEELQAELAAKEEAEAAANFPDPDPEVVPDSTNTRETLTKMGRSNPVTLLYASPVGPAEAAVTMEGGEKIMQTLGQVEDIAGRVAQTFTVGKGLTGTGYNLLGAKLAKMTIGQIVAMFDAKNVDPEQAFELSKRMRDLTLALYNEIITALLSLDPEDTFKSFDLTLQGSFNFPRVSVMFFEYEQFFMVGGLIPMTFAFGAGASYGMEITVGAKILAMTVFGSVKPYANAHVYGELGIGFVLYGKLRLDGYIMTVAFPSYAEIGFSKFPLDLTLKMDLELTPIELKLSALVTLEVKIPLIGTIKKTLFKASLFRYSTPTIRKRMVDVRKAEEDETPPQFLQYVDKTGSSRKRRAAVTNECIVSQLPDRDYTQPAFEIAVRVEDDLSQVELVYDAGTQPGLSDLAAGEPLGGPSSIVTKRISTPGVPVYFTVKGKNSGGTGTEVTCSIPTYDVTLPGGRLTPWASSTSNPAVAVADVVVYEDSEIKSSYIGLGYGKRHYSDEAVPYYSVNLKERDKKTYDPTDDAAGYRAITHFTKPRQGRLPGPVMKTLEGVTHAALCAKECLKYAETKCLSVNYDYGPAATCELVEAIEGHTYNLTTSGQFTHIERLGIGLVEEFEHKGLSLQHERMYYFNLHLQNVLGYESIISSKGILVDLTPPDPGPVANVSQDTLTYTACTDLIPDDRPDHDIRCAGVNNNVKNHRIVKDGEGSACVFNGPTPLVDLLYTRANRFVAANWDGVLDKQTGISLYSLTVGREPCEELVHPYYDPQKHLHDESEWTHTALISPIPAPHDPLPDGKYYITLRALNKVEYGGPLVTTICHTTPIGVDNSPPFMYEVFDVTYDEDTHVINFKYNASDPQSNIREVDMCLGHSPRDCVIMDWVRSYHSENGITLTFEITGGVPAWVKARAINHVSLMRVGVADYPIIVDVTPPEAGIVYDGSLYKHDLKYTKNAAEFCANWFGFYDPESGISKYELQVQNKTGTNLSQPQTVDHKTHKMCVQLQPDSLMEHGDEYTLRLTAYNAGHNQLGVTAFSDGVLVDLTVPVEGEVIDGRLDNFTDMEYSTHVATVAGQWKDYYDPESGLREYSVQVTRAKNLSTGLSDFEVIRDWETVANDTSIVEWHNLHLYHRDTVKITLRSTNNALGIRDTTTNGFVVDLTPPRMRYVNDGGEQGVDAEYQYSMDTVEANFDFFDEESGLNHFKYQVYETYHGSKHQIYPGISGSWEELRVPEATTLSQSGLSLKVGALYSLRIGATNNAGSVAIYNTNGLILDNTKPTMKWVHVTTFSDSDEEIFNGYAIQSDPEGIKATWFATDPQSGIQKYFVSVGTTEGGNEVLDWTDVGSERDRYIDGLSLNVTDIDTQTPVYYVTVKSGNGAGLTSDVMTSHPIRVVKQDSAGLVIDGPDDTQRPNHIKIGTDMDYQRDTGTVTVQFDGFESHEHGMTYFDWAVGTTPGGEEVQPFIMAGLIHEETEMNVPGNGIASTGFGQAILPLKTGTKYYTTVRGITNGGNILQSTSDGFTVDRTPPNLSWESFANEDNATKLTPDTVFYQSEVDSISASWRVIDSDSPITKMTFSVGTFPYGEDVQEKTEVKLRPNGEGALPSGINPNTEGKPNIITLTAENEVGLTASICSPQLIVDVTVPTAGTVECPQYIQPLSSVECTWSDFFEAESRIVKFTVAVVTNKVNEHVIPPVDLDGNVNRHILQGLGGKVQHGKKYYAKVTATNTNGFTSTSFSNAIVVDTTPPVGGTVVELGSSYIIDVTSEARTVELNRYTCDTSDACLSIDATCQESFTTVLVAWEAFTDSETAVVKYEIAVGNTPGGGQLKQFFEVPDTTQRYFSVKGLVLKGEKKVYVTVKATNGAGLSSVSTSNGVYISYLSQGQEPLSHVGVWDGISKEGDVHFQTSLSTMGARWDVSGDPCPVVKYEWAIHRADGLVAQDFVDTEGRTFGVNDQMQLKNKERYYQVLRVTNALDFIYILWSNGITVEEQPLIPGEVYDGGFIGKDLKFHHTKDKLSCNWDKFGSDGISAAKTIQAVNVPSGSDTVDNQQVAYYEVAIGTDRRYPKTRDNVRAYINVGLNKKFTFVDLELTPLPAVYYCTVRAYSTSGSMAEITSNGASVILDGGVSGGKITMTEFVNDKTSFRVSWSEFESRVGMMLYYVGLSTKTDADQVSCDEFTGRGNQTEEDKAAVFDVVNIENVDKDTFKKFQKLRLTQGATYYVWVIGVDKASECKMVNRSFVVDATPPDLGKARTGPDYDMVSNYAPSSTVLEVFWKDFKDDESGIRRYHLTLLRKVSCEEGAEEEVVIPSVEIDATHSHYKFTTRMERDKPYYIRVVAENHAFLQTTAFTPLTLFDDTLPKVGRVVDGHDFIKDISWVGNKDMVTGTFLAFPGFGKSACPIRHITPTDPGWEILKLKSVRDSSNRVLSLEYQPRYATGTDESLSIKMVKTKKDELLSGAFYRDADLVNGGEYKIQIKPASSTDGIITSVLFWDGSMDYVLDYDFTYLPGFDTNNCDCCLEYPLPPECICECDNYYRSRQKRSADTPPGPATVVRLNPEEIAAAKKRNSAKDVTRNIKLDPRNSCGLQIYGGTNSGRIVSWCQFQDGLLLPKSQKRDLNFDPSTDFHNFVIKFVLRRPEARESEINWCYMVFMDGEMISELCGIPQLSLDTKLVLSVWNHKNFIPENVREDGHIKAWSAQASFKNLVMPPEKDKLCRYGDPFQGGNNPVIRYEGAVESEDGSRSEFKSIDVPCIPCLKPCDRYSCDAECNSTETRQIKFNLTDLDLNETTIIDGETKSIIYFLVVKAILASGASAEAKSDGFYLDTTPPEMDTSTIYFDVDQGDFKPISFQSSNNTIKAAWKCKDEQSAVVEYLWAIGISPGGEDILPITSTGENPGGTLTDLTLLDHVTYYVTVTCVNGAGLKSVHSATGGVQVLLGAPEVDEVAANIEGSEALDSVNPPHSSKTYDQTSVGCYWDVSPDPSIRRYEFCVGSCRRKVDNILPCTWVGYNQSGTVYIKDGWIQIDGFKIHKLSSYRPGSTEPDTGDDPDAFRMAPGSVLCITMRVCNEADKCTDKRIGNVVIETPNSNMVTSTDGRSVRTRIGVGPPGRRKRDASSITIQTPDGMLPGQSIVVTELTREDLEKVYKSDASPDFVPYITDPNNTLTDFAFLDRILRRRLNYSADDISFSITSIGDLEMPGPLLVTYPYDPLDTEFIFMLLHWDPDTQKWIQSNKTCQFEGNTEVRDPVNSLITVKVCHTRASNETSTSDTYFSTETQFLVRNVLIEIPNDPPVLTTTTTLNMTEDAGTLLYEMTAEDPDGDIVRFRPDPSSPTTEGDLGITTNGLMIFTPSLDYNGNVKIPVVLYEVEVVEIPPATATVTVTVTIEPVNDAPNIFTFREGESLILTDPTLPILCLVEQNRINETDPVPYQWLSGAYDVDVPETLTVFFTQPSNGTLSYAEDKVTPYCSNPGSSSLCANLSLTNDPSAVSWIYRTFTYLPDPGFYGYDEMRVYIQDQEGVYSDVITLNLAVMERLCENGGVCKSRNEAEYTCANYRRAEGFDNYYTCDCQPGWTGAHCEIDVDECISSPCTWPYACYDDINKYYCACPVTDPNCDGLETWMIALIGLACVLLIIISLLAWFFVMVKRGRLQWKVLFSKYMYRRSTAGSVSSDDKNSRTAFVNKAFDEGDFASLGFNQETFRPRSYSSGEYWLRRHGKSAVGANYPAKSPDQKNQSSGALSPSMISNPRMEDQHRSPSPLIDRLTAPKSRSQSLTPFTDRLAEAKSRSRSPSPLLHHLLDPHSRSVTPVETDSPGLERRWSSDSTISPSPKMKKSVTVKVVSKPDYFG